MKFLSNEKGNGGVGVFGLLGIIFVTLKLLGKLDWSWLWVTAPFWGGIALWLVLVVVAVTLTFLFGKKTRF